MTFAMLENLLPSVLPKELLTKGNFDKVNGIEMKKPEIAVSGVHTKTGDSVKEPQLNGNQYAPIIADPPNFRKEIGAIMSDEGFIKLPRSLLKSEIWKSLRQRQQKLFIYILEKAQHSPYIFKYNGNDISLSPGDLCISLRRLVDDYNCTVKFKDEKIDLPFVQRAVSTFSKVGLTDTRTDTGISIVRVVFPGIYDSSKYTTDTRTDTETIQHRYTNEERKEGKEIKETIDGADRSSLLNKEKKEEQGGPSIFDVDPSSQINDLSEEKKKMLSELWKYAINLRVSEGNTKCPKPGIKQSDIAGWLKIYEVKDIAEAIKMTSDKTIRIGYGAYITTLLQKKVPTKKGNVQINDEFLQEIMKKHKCSHLQDTKQYVTDTIKHVDYQKNTDPKMFKDMIMASLAMASNYDQREGDYRQESEYEDDY